MLKSILVLMLLIVITIIIDPFYIIIERFSKKGIHTDSTDTQRKGKINNTTTIDNTLKEREGAEDDR